MLLDAKKLSQERSVPEIHWQLALLYNKLGRNKEAADELEEQIVAVFFTQGIISKSVHCVATWPFSPASKSFTMTCRT